MLPVNLEKSFIYDSEGRVSLTEIWKLLGGKRRCRPAHFTRSDKCKSLCESLGADSIASSFGRYSGGTFAAKPIALAYAYWINSDKMAVIISDKLGEMEKLISALSEFDIPDDLPDMFVYAIREKDSGNIKIGISKHPQERLRQLQVANSSELELVAVVPAKNRYRDEAIAHIENSAHHIRSEWFTGEAAIL